MAGKHNSRLTESDRSSVPDPSQPCPNKRVGLIIPSTNTVMEPDLYRHLPHWVTVHTTRMLVDEEITAEVEERMLDDLLPRSAKEISTLKPDVVVFGCTTAGALRGPAYEQRLAQELSCITGAPTVTIMSAVVEELRRHGSRRIVILSPYSQQVNQTIQRFLEAFGLQIVHMYGMDISSGSAIADVTSSQLVDYVRAQLRDVEADCVFLSCANLRALDALDDIQEAAGIPVVTSNQVVLEQVKRLLDFDRQ